MLKQYIIDYQIPNIRDDIFEFMQLTISNITAKKNDYTYGDEINAWYIKLDQIYEHGKVWLDNPDDIVKLENMYNNNCKSIKKIATSTNSEENNEKNNIKISNENSRNRQKTNTKQENKTINKDNNKLIVKKDEKSIIGKANIFIKNKYLKIKEKITKTKL